MKIQHLFCKEECEAVEDDYGNHIVYRAFRAPCLSLGRETRTFSIHPSDLFYQCFYTLDELKSKTASEGKGYCAYELFNELENYVNRKVSDVDEEEVKLAVCAILQAVAEFLVHSGREFYTLAELVKEKIPGEISLKLDNLFRQGFRCVNEEEATRFMVAYMKSNQCLSEEIHALLDEQEESVQEDPEHTLRIADGKKRSVVVALKAIIESDWVEDVNGGRPTNIEKAVNEILRLAFGEKKKTALSQTIKPSSDIDFEGSMNRIAEELADKIKGFASEKSKKR